MTAYEFTQVRRAKTARGHEYVLLVPVEGRAPQAIATCDSEGDANLIAELLRSHGARQIPTREQVTPSGTAEPARKVIVVENLSYASASAEFEEARERMASGPDASPGIDGTPAWCYDEDGYCIRCGNGRWKHHTPGCELRDLLDKPGSRPEDR